jgi:hypothetical protein
MFTPVDRFCNTQFRAKVILDFKETGGIAQDAPTTGELSANTLEA